MNNRIKGDRMKMIQGRSGTYYSPRYYFIDNGLIYCRGRVKKQDAPSFNGNALIETASEKLIQINTKETK